MKFPAAVAVVLIACGGTSEREKTPETAPEPAAKPVPVPERDCTVLAPAVERITANEVAELFRTRPIDVARIAAVDLERVAPTLREVMPALCEAEAWSGAYTACMTGARLRADARACQVHLTQAQLDKLAEKVAGGVPGTYSGLPPDCQDFIALMQQMMVQCPAMRQMQPDQGAFQQAIDQMVTSWKQASTTPEGAKTTAEACKLGKDSVGQSLASMGCGTMSP